MVKLNTEFTYLTATGPPAPPILTQTKPHPPRQKFKVPPWTRRRLRTQQQIEAKAAFQAILNDFRDTAIIDSGTTVHLSKESDGLKLTGPSNLSIAVATGQHSQTTATALLPLENIRPEARITHILPELQPNSLLSVKQLADNGYVTIFHPHDKGVTVHDENDIRLTSQRTALLQGWRDAQGLWRVALKPSVTNVNTDTIAMDRPAPTEAVYNVYELPSTRELVAFLHASLGYPTKATLVEAARRGFLTSFPGLTVENINKFFPESEETQKGHMRQQRQGVRSTKIVDEDATSEGFKQAPGIKHKDVYLRVYDATKRTMYTDQTGRVPIVSSRGNKYIMVAVELDGNYIDCEPMRDRTTKSLVTAYQTIFTRWKQTGVISPNWHILDNEAPEEFKLAIRDNGCKVELVPPDMHRRNAAKRAIQTFKGHCIATLAGVSNDFPINQWDRLLPQMIATLAILRPSNVAPNISSYAYHHGQFDFNRTPLAPMGCAVQFHNKPNKRKSWAQSTTQPLPVSSNRKPITQQRPRVQFSPTVQPNVNNGINAYPPRVQEPVECPRVEDDEVDQVQVKPQSPITALPRESIADRVKTRCRQPEPEEPSSIAQRVAMRWHEFAAPHPRFKEAWSISAANEFGRLAQGVGGRVKGTDTIRFIPKSEVPEDRFKDVTYIRMVCQVRTEKKEPNRSRATVGGNLIKCEDDIGTPTADLLLIKIFFNSVISTPGARFANADLANFYLMTPLKRPEFTKIRLDNLPDEIVDEYKLKEIATPDGWVYIRITRGMYGLPQSGALANELLEKQLNAEGYFQSKIVPGFWKHDTRDLQFVLVVDDFGIKYLREEDLDHLIATLKKHYDVALDKEGKEFVKIELGWDYDQGKVHLSMKPYRDKALRQFDNLEPSKAQDSPYPHVPIKYGAAEQFVETDESPSVGKDEQKHVQKVNGKFLWYARAVDGTLLTPLSALATQQANPTTNTMKRVKQFLDFVATQDPAVLTYRKSVMVLAAHSDASYLNESAARSRAGGHHFLSENVKHPPNNGAILNVAEIIKAVMSSASESERIIYQREKSSRRTYHSRRNGPSATADTHPNG
eukprot:CCRYP_018913-RA/>CCRYP_018913-RA protein AED:0.17 eAED:0.19 QI:0/0/0/1/0.25/0/5/0/1080